MALYYFKKYTLGNEYLNDRSTGNNPTVTLNGTDINIGIQGYPGYRWSEIGGYLLVGGLTTVRAGDDGDAWSKPVYTMTSTSLVLGQLKKETDGKIYRYSSTIRVCDVRIGVREGVYLETTIAEEGTYPNNGKSGSYWYIRGELANAIPTITLNTTDNRTLYENDILNINGNATDIDSGNVVTIKYSINGGTVRAIATAISTGVDIPFNKSLTFKQNMLYDEVTAITTELAEGTQHTLKVWAEDDQGGKSLEQTRVFYVVPNRPATLTINPFSPTNDLINTDYVTISGNISDPDGNTVKVSYKIANGSLKEFYNGTGGDFQFQVQLLNLAEGKNNITIQAEDSYGAKTTKTLEVTKGKNEVPLKTAVARYKLSPPNGTAKGIILWIEREVGDLVIDVEISMGMNGEAENFVPMTKNSTAFVREGIEEDEFTFEADSPKENIIIKITMERTSTNSNKGITLISGVLS